MKSRSQTLLNSLLYTVFALYAIILLFMLIFKNVPISELLSTNRQLYRAINIVPFHSIMRYASGADRLGNFNVLGNVFLFLPLGAYLTMFRRDKRIWTNTGWVCLISLFVEVAQYILAVGVSDIDDIILNSLGGFVGVAAYKALLMVLKDERKARNLAAVIAALIVLGLCLYYLYLLHTGVRIRISAY